jgi:GR25 family glycosyltransferase involved in LPS biosynthesis
MGWNCSFFLLASIFCFAGIEDHYKPIEFKGESRGPEGIDFVYMMNLDQRPERWKNATELLKPYLIVPQRFSGIYGWTIPPEVLNDISLQFDFGMWTGPETGHEWVLYFDPNGDGTPQAHWLSELLIGKGVFSGWTVKGTIGCSLGHLSILKDAYDSGYETIWVLEDDISIVQNPHLLTERIKELDGLVREWDVLYTDNDALVVDMDKDIASQIPMMWRPDMPFLDVHFLAEHQDISDHLKKIGSRMRAHSIIYRRCGIKKILDFYREHGNFLPYDQELPLVPNIQLYVIKDSIVSVHEETTDTRYRNF